MEARLRAGFWVKAQLRLCDQRMIPMVVRRRGDADAGTVLIKIDRLDGTAQVLTPVTGADGRRVWSPGTGEAPVPDADAEAYIERQTGYDPDLWVLEVEDGEGKYQPDAEA